MAPAAKYATDNQIIYDQLAATYLLFAFNKAIILHTTNDLRVWRGILIGILMCDTIHLYGSWAALGGIVFWDPRTWRPEDWVSLVSLWGQAAVRLAFVAGVGLKPVTAKRVTGHVARRKCRPRRALYGIRWHFADLGQCFSKLIRQ